LDYTYTLFFCLWNGRDRNNRRLNHIQVILNILNNAIDAYTENKYVSDKIILISSQEVGSHVKILREDRAGGIKPDVMKQLFEPYFSTKEKNGTGLGLYMSKMILEKQFDGTINVKH